MTRAQEGHAFCFPLYPTMKGDAILGCDVVHIILYLEYIPILASGTEENGRKKKKRRTMYLPFPFELKVDHADDLEMEGHVELTRAASSLFWEEKVLMR